MLRMHRRPGKALNPTRYFWPNGPDRLSCSHMVTINSSGWLDEEFPLGDGVADTESEAVCPYCGEVVLLALDPGSGPHQEYVEDCEVCCRPWQVNVAFDPEGRAEVAIRQLDE
jgi:hypothetical protein